MSAYLCNTQTFGILAHFAIQSKATKYGVCYGSGLDTTDKVVEVLVQANLTSLQARYPDMDAALEFAGQEATFYIKECQQEAKRAWNVPAIEIIKSIDCLNYQSCEYDEWYGSLAYKILDCIKSTAIKKLPGYEAAQWGYSTDNPPPVVRSLSSLKGRAPQSGECISLFS